MLKGTLDMMILRTLMGRGRRMGRPSSKIIERTSEDVLEVEQVSLYPALHRLEDRGWVSSSWGAKREQSQGEVLPAHSGGKEAAFAGNDPLAADETRDWPGDGRGVCDGRRRGMSLRRFFRRRRADAELMEEMESYMAEEIAESTARGIRRKRHGGGRGRSSVIPAPYARRCGNRTPSRSSTTSGVI